MWLTFSILISRSAIFRTAMSSSVSRKRLMATIWPDSRCLHLSTSPYEPSPTTPRVSYFSMAPRDASAHGPHSAHLRKIVFYCSSHDHRKMSVTRSRHCDLRDRSLGKRRIFIFRAPPSVGLRCRCIRRKKGQTS